MDELAVQNHSSSYYEQRYRGFGCHYHQTIVDWMIEGMRGQLLDVGCGTGFVALVNPGLDIIGIDFSSNMLARHPCPWKTYQMDACKMTFTNDRFDGIVCRSLLHHLSDYYQGLSEMFRVLKPGGKIAFWEPSRSALAKRIRAWTQHGDRFSEYHRSFTDKELVRDIQKWFVIDAVEYFGFLAYPLYGFSDIINFQRYIPGNRVIYPMTQAIDRWLSRTPWLKRLSWSIGIKAHKMLRSLNT